MPTDTYVHCAQCNRSTRVENWFPNGEQILWCGHHRQGDPYTVTPEGVAKVKPGPRPKLTHEQCLKLGNIVADRAENMAGAYAQRHGERVQEDIAEGERVRLGLAIENFLRQDCGYQIS